MAETSSELQAEVEKLERKHAENPEGRYFVPLANAYRKLGQLQAAESLLREGLRRHPEYLSAHIVLGRCLADHGAIGEAAEEFRYVLSLDPQNLVALRSLGELSLSAGRPEEAGRWYQELLAADPMNDEARRALESLRTAAGAAPGASVPDVPADAVAPPEGPRAPDIAPEPEELPAPSGSVRAGDEEYAFYGGGYVELEEVSAPAPAPALDEDAVEEDEEEDAPELVTETIAELYARQGLYARSAEVYRELVRRRGGDPALERRLAEVERLASGEPAPPAEPALPAEAAPPPFEGEPLPAVIEPEPVAPPEDDFWISPPGADLPEPVAAEVAGPDLRAPQALPDLPGFEPVPAAAASAAPSGAGEAPSISRFLADLAAWRPGAAPAEAGPGEGEGEGEVDLPLYTAPAPAPAPGERPSEPVYGTGSAGEDPFPWELPEPEGAAPEGAEEPAEEALFSYADFLAEEEPPRAEPEPPAAESEPAPPAPAAPASAAAEDDDDLESFQAWLRSLKR